MDKASDKAAPSVCIILLNYNGATITYKGESILKLTLDSIRKQDYGNSKLIVVDNGSSDNSKELIRRYKPDLVDIKDNIYNFSAVNNIAIKYAIRTYDPTYLLLMSNDVFLSSKNFVRSLVNSAIASKAGITSSRLMIPSEHGFKQQEVPAHSANAACFLISQKTLRNVGLLDENFVMGSEDSDYWIRTRNSGQKMIVDDHAKAVHLVSYTIREDKDRLKLSEHDKRMHFYYWKRNNMYFIRKHTDEYGPLPLFKEIALYFASISFGVRRTRKNRRTFSIEKKRPYSYIPIVFKSILSALTMKEFDTRFNLSYKHDRRIKYWRFTNSGYVQKHK